MRSEGSGVKTKLKMRCRDCGCWNTVPVDKIFLEQKTSESNVKAYIPMYRPLHVVECKECRKVTATPKELIRIVKY